MDFGDLVRACTFPHCVCITHGHFVSKQVQICCGDVLILKSCAVEQVTLCFQTKNDTSAFSPVKVNITLDCSVKFKVLPPTNTDSSENTIVYPTIADLLLDCPTHFEATTSYDDPYLPRMSVNKGDRFWFVRIIKDLKNGQERLQVRDSKDNIVILSQDCKGHFRPLKDENEYTMRELVDMAPVQRRLIIDTSNVISDIHAICNNSQESDISKMDNNTVTQIYNQNSTSLEFHIAHEHLPFPSDSIVYMLKPQLTVIVSPCNDLETTWEVPATANIKVRTYSQSEYEVPVSKLQQPQSCTMNNTLLDDELPMFRAPSAPPLPQPQIPIDLRNFVDIYCSSFPVIAKFVNKTELHPFFQQMFTGLEEIIICRLDVMKRLYVKDTKSDTIFALSKDVRLSFVEYPQRLKVVSEFVCLPIGSEVIVLEDIAADFPKPLSLRFGDIIRVSSNIPSVIKTKLGSGYCHVLKCERIDPEAGGSTRLKLPLDFEVTMLLKTDHNCSRLISMHDLLDGIIPLPSQSVTCVSEDVNNEAIYELPTDLQILTSLKETCLVVKTPSTFFTQMSHSVYSPKEGSLPEYCSGGESAKHPTIGIPLTSRLILAFRERLIDSELHEETSVVDFIAPPIEKMTVAEFETRQRHLQEHTDYEDVESGSSSTMDEYESTSDASTRANSDGILEKKQKNPKVDSVRRFGQTLNPKYWRQAKSKPPPLPHPSALGPSHFTINQNRTDEMGFTSVFSESTKDEYTSLELITTRESEDENLYEELEINPSKSTISTTAELCQNSAFSGPEYAPLPPSNTPPKLFPKCADTPALAAASGSGIPCLTEPSGVIHSTAKKFSERFEGHSKKYISDIYKPLIRVKNWANNLGNSMGNRFSIRFKEDTPKSNKVNNDHNGVDYEVASSEKTCVPNTSIDDRHVDLDVSLTPAKSQSERWELNDKRSCANESFSSFMLQQQHEDSFVSANDFIENQTGREEQESTISSSIDFKPSVCSQTLELQIPKPKPRNLNKSFVLERGQCCSVLSPIINDQLSLNAIDYVEHTDILPDKTNSSLGDPGISFIQTIENNRPPKPLPKPRNCSSTKV